MLKNKIPKEERRKYRRLDSIFPVEFQIVNQEGSPASTWYQAFSQDVSRAGLCFTVNNLSKDEFCLLKGKEAVLLLQIHVPFSDKSFLAYAQTAWIYKVQELPLPQYIVGVHFTRIDEAQIKRLLSYARFRNILWYTLMVLIVGMVALLGIVVAKNYRLQSRNLELLGRYSVLLEDSVALNNRYQLLHEDRERLMKLLNDESLELAILNETLKKTEAAKHQEITQLEKKLAESREATIASTLDATNIEKLKTDLEALKKNRDEEVLRLKNAIVALQENASTINNDLAEIIAQESEIKESFSTNQETEMVFVQTLKEKLYHWLARHQNQRTGLVVSFEGDYNLRATSFLYDHALATITYTLFGDYERARRGLDFFLKRAARIERRGFYNAYYSNNGDVAEYTAHAGPNLWLGIAITQFTHKTGDHTYLTLARQIADWIETLQDAEGGIVGGRNILWYSTEHNLDGYAFFTMLYELTREEHYKVNAEKILRWLEKYAYGNEEIPIHRGKGDATIATDTYAWSIAALGPPLLEHMSMDPHQIAAFAIEHCAVTVKFNDRLGKEINVSGFDFAKQTHTARGGVISCEWTAQMILAFRLLSDYYAQKKDIKKASYYQAQAMKYVNELNKMIITSPSAFGQGGWCFPYASQENVDTGHGWRTPHGSRTGSVAATAHALFALSKNNPLVLIEKQ